MRLSCLQENLNKGLGTVGRAVATRTTLPITQNVLLTTDLGRLKLSATNLEVAISTWIGAQVEEEGAITVPARLLTDFVSSLPNERIDVTSHTQPLGLSLKCAKFEAAINGADAEDFPPIPTVKSGATGKFKAEVLRDAISHVAFAAATEDSRPVLTGVKVDIKRDGFTFAAADGFRLAVYTGKLAEPAKEDVSFIIPAKSLAEVNRLAVTQTDPVEFMVTPAKSQALFVLHNIELVSQLVQGTFPNYQQLMPQRYETRAVIDLRQFSAATKTASIFARDGSGIIRLQVQRADGGGKVAISSRAEEVGENKGEIDAKVEGTDSKIAFNSKYLAEVLDVLGTGEVALETTSPSSPGVLRPVDKTGYVHVVMPMFVQW
ncbi:MAG: DNA polymerase III subunit beta [SAR202 cluster bacterium]|nr:DNA polymerase III subunit beta [SAR202 cluster bacterium]